ncbi:MAG TPA: lysylphosphatidylglycerol synthase transmembrane domain-containing protein [Motilibacteraceae bacterium]|nr:lysylphosphatidylglycerol synthase transmembrane domain-containing protein [Motilibacteraceae bacterium]
MTEQTPEQTQPARPSLRSRLLTWGLLALVVAGFAVALGGRWGEVARELGRLDVGALVASLVLAVVAVACSGAAWARVLADLGSPVPARPAARLFFVSQLGKYVPGSVWPVVVQMRLGRALGVPRTRTALAFVITVGLSIVVGGLVGLAGLPALARHGASAVPWLVAVAAGVGVVVLHPRVLNGALSLALRLLRRPPLEQPLPGRGIGAVTLWLLAFWVAAGLHIWVLAVDLGAPAGRSLPAAVGGFALAFCAGVLVVLLPAGAGVREVALTAALGTVLPAGAAVAIALVSRFLLAVTDGLLAGVAWLLDRSPGLPVPSSPEPADPSPTDGGRPPRA